MITTIPTHTLLNMTLEEYENDCFERYMRWCELMASAYSQRQKKEVKPRCLISNSGMASYYQDQVRELLQFFNISASKMYNTVSYKLSRSHYCEVMAELSNNYPSALIEAAASVNIENQISLN